MLDDRDWRGSPERERAAHHRYNFRMSPIPILLVVGAAVALGLYLGWRFLRRQPGKPMLIGAHLVLAILGLEGAVILMTGAPNGERLEAGEIGRAAGVLLILAVVTGFLASLIAPRRPRKVGLAALGAHAAVALAGFGLFVAWALGH